MTHRHPVRTPPVLVRRAAFLTVLVLAGLALPRTTVHAARSDVAGNTTSPCDVTLSTFESVVDGKELPQVAGGGTICLEHGIRGNLKLQNLHGTPEQPVVVRNEGGVVQITGTEFEAAINIATSSYLRVSGAGESAECGAGYERDTQACGITIDGARKGIKVATAKGEIHDITLDHLAVLRVDSPVETRGIAIHPVPRQVVSGITIIRNYIANTGAEGIYVGSEPRDTPWAELGKVDHVEIAYNVVEDIGWDGIKLKVAISGSSVHHNEIRNTGIADYEKHRSGITVARSVVDVHHNTVNGSVEGINSGRGVEHATNLFHDNVVANVQLFGILTTDDRASIHHNTVVGSAGIGIKARGDATRIVENIVADAAEPIVHRADATVRNNLITTTAAARFVDAMGGNFGLRDTSPARSAGSITRVDVCTVAAMRVGRPIGFLRHFGDRDVLAAPSCRRDIGASPLS